MEKENKYEFERQQCLLLKAKIVSCMTDNVKSKIASNGYTPTEIATAYILRKLNCVHYDYRAADAHSLNLTDHKSVPDYVSIVFDESGTQIIDVLF